MDMRYFSSAAFTAVSFLLAGTLTSCGGPDKGKEDSSKPNIIYILADDLGYGDLSFQGQTRFETPNIDQLARDGMVFTQHYSGSTVCAPSRSSLLTGQHTGHTPIRGNKEIFPEGQHPMPADTYTLAKMVKEEGYATACFGKWGLGFPGSEGDPVNQGFDLFFGYNCQRMAHHYYPWYLWHNTEKFYLEGNEGKQENEYGPDVIHEFAMDFLESNRDQPFFMFYASLIPHAELFAPDSILDQFKGKYLPEVHYEGVDDGPDYRIGPYGSQEHSHAAFVAMVTILDRQVGEIVQKLEELGIADNTLIIFTSDNGPHQEGGADPEYFDSNGPFRGFKRDLYEGGIRVPMIAKWPEKINPGTTSDHVSAFWDVLPTVAEILDKESPEGIDGISFLPTLTGKGEQKEHPYLYWEFHERGGRIAVRQGKWKGVRYDVKSNPEKEMELYNLESDPGEETNLAGEYPEKVKELMQIMAEARTDSEVFQFSSSGYLQKDK
jgi:arylsulfatase A-like enzyme